jgi:hypothetical protein
MDIPNFLIPIVVLEVLAVIVVIWGLWILFTDKFEPDELEIAARRRVHSTGTRKASNGVAVPPAADQKPKPTGVAGHPSPTTAAKRDDSEKAAAVSGENTSDEIDPSWPPPRNKVVLTEGRVVLSMVATYPVSGVRRRGTNV